MMKRIIYLTIFILLLGNISWGKIPQHLTLTIKDAIRIGIENNLTAKLDKAREEELKYQLGKVESLFWPKIKAEYSYNITSYSKELKSNFTNEISGYYTSIFTSPYIGFTNTSEYTNILRIFLECYIFTWGKNSRKARIARLKLEIQKLLNKAKERNLIYQITETYFRVLYNKIMFSLVAEYIGSFKALYSHIKSEDQQLILDDNYNFFTEKLYYYEKELSLSKTVLKRYLGIGNLSPEVSVELKESYFPMELKKFKREDALSLAVSNRMDKAVLEKEEKLLKNKISIKKKEYMPDIKFISEWDWIDYQDSKVRPYIEENTQGLLAIKVDLPIFDGFEKANTIRALEQQLKQLNYQKKQKIRDIVFDIDTALLNVERYWDTSQTLKTKAATKRKLLNLAIDKFQKQKISLEKLADLYLKTFLSEEEKNRSFLKYNLALIKLYRAMGIISNN